MNEDKPAGLSPEDIYALTKSKIANEVLDEVIQQVKMRFWVYLIVSSALFITAAWWLIKGIAEATTGKLSENAVAANVAGTPDFHRKVLAEFAKAHSHIVETPSPVSCDQQDWAKGMRAIAMCPAHSIPVGGGCAFTCMGMDHTLSIPIENGWKCGVLSKDATRTFTAWVQCYSSE